MRNLRSRRVHALEESVGGPTEMETMPSASTSVATVRFGRVRKPGRTVARKPDRESSTAKSGTGQSQESYKENSDPEKVESWNIEEMMKRLSLSWDPDTVVGREAEKAELAAVVTRWIDSQEGGGIYVSGLPGSGKSVTVHWSVRRIRQSKPSVRVVMLNCASIVEPLGLYQSILRGLDEKAEFMNRREAKEALQNILSRRPVIVVLDEIDLLASRDMMILYSIFELPKTKQSKLVLIGIGNALDLPARTLPWLRSSGCVPHMIQFRPYDGESLVKMVTTRVPTLAALALPAIKLCAMKVAATSGDARVVLDGLCSALSRWQKQTGQPLAVIVSKTLEDKGGISRAVEALRSLPLQQQLVISSVHSHLCGTRKMKRSSMRELYTEFDMKCKKLQVNPLPFSPFADVITSLAHHSLVAIKPSKTQRASIVTLTVSCQELKDAFKGNRLLEEAVGRCSG